MIGKRGNKKEIKNPAEKYITEENKDINNHYPFNRFRVFSTISIPLAISSREIVYANRK